MFRTLYFRSFDLCFIFIAVPLHQSHYNQIEMSELRKWEDLDFDCLVDIFERLDMESLLLGVPFVCKSWYKASRSPSCWQHIDFGEFCDHDNYEQTYSTCVLRFIDAYQVQRFSFGKFVRLIVARGLGQSTCLVLPLGCSYKALNHVAKM